jgi:hypothetical protein
MKDAPRIMELHDESLAWTNRIMELFDSNGRDGLPEASAVTGILGMATALGCMCKGFAESSFVPPELRGRKVFLKIVLGMVEEAYRDNPCKIAFSDEPPGPEQ